MRVCAGGRASVRAGVRRGPRVRACGRARRYTRAHPRPPSPQALCRAGDMTERDLSTEMSDAMDPKGLVYKLQRFLPRMFANLNEAWGLPRKGTPKLLFTPVLKERAAPAAAAAVKTLPARSAAIPRKAGPK